MKVIVFAATKGGVGKTTLAYNIAVEAAKRSLVLIADLDPQKSLKELWQRRGELVNPRLLTSIDSVPQAVKLLTQAGYQHEYLVIDTPGSLMPIIRDAVAAADLVVLPVQPSPLDLLAQEAVAQLVGAMGKQTMFVLNRTESRLGATEQYIDYLKPMTPLPVQTVANRVYYSRAAVSGKAVGEMSKDAAKEIKTLWRAIQAAMEPKTKTTHTEKTHDRQIH